jgi:hypothetical protein
MRNYFNGEERLHRYIIIVDAWRHLVLRHLVPFPHKYVFFQNRLPQGQGPIIESKEGLFVSTLSKVLLESVQKLITTCLVVLTSF